MSQHTPGPWRLPPIEAGTPWNIEGPNGESVAIAFPLTNVRTDPAQSVRHANARLIAAAPDLLALVRDMLPELAEYAASVDCDHTVGICSCGLRRLVDDARSLLNRLDGPVTP